ncbi:phosphatase PAP2 family protein [Bradyrhizobium sp. 193]|uniref:Ig-like domain-containing protein n=1 Tax=Bradyrhizobium sp. 193 TaxID=2782661 RepID=UPI001FF71815|nr:Ig-like domain-containing protein [Bradyrhizobium sp. 193]MCK1485082.1 phosphatase PAP2 family protein [Bradyrhizobium sp. 193]
MATLSGFDLDATSHGFDGLVSYKERGPAQKLAPNTVLSASGDFGGQTLTLSGLTSEDHIGFATGVDTVGALIRVRGKTIATFAGGVDGSDFVITFRSDVTASQVQSLLRSITFQSENSSPPLSQTITFDLAGTARTEMLTFQQVNNAPVLDLNGPSFGSFALVSYLENEPLKVIAPSAIVRDVDSADFSGGSLRVSFVTGATNSDQLSISTTGTVTVSGSTVSVNGAAIGTLSGGNNGSDLLINFNSAATPALIETLVHQIGYSNSSENPLTGPKLIAFRINDGDGARNGGHDTDVAFAAIQVTGVNDAPVIDLNGVPPGTSATLQYRLGDPLTALAPTASVVDLDSADFGGGSLHVAITQNGTRSDRLAIGTDSVVSVTGVGNKSSVKINGTPIGTVSGGSNGDELVIAFNSLATTDRVQILLDHIGYLNPSSSSSTLTREVTFRLTDGDGTAHGAHETGSATAFVLFSSVNLPPGTAAAVGSGTEDTSVAITLSGSDVDGTVSSFRIVSIPANGQLYSDALLTAQLQAGDSVLASNNFALVYFKPASNWNGSTNFDYASIDSSGAQDATPATASITVTPVNDAPAVASGTLTIAEDATASPLGLSAPTDIDGDALTITVTGLPAKGTVYLTDGITAVVNGQTLSGGQLTGLLFTPAVNVNGDAGLFRYTVSDGIAAPVAGSVAITITPQNDAPVAASGTLTIAEDAAASPLGLSAPTDVDGDALTITVTGLPAKGTVYLTDGITAVVNGQTLSGGQLTGLLFTPAVNVNGDAGLFSYTVSDGIAAPVAGSVAITITPEAGGEVIIPIISRIEDDTGLAGDGLTSDRTLTLSGTATPGNLIVSFLDGEEIGTTTVGASGEWTFDYSAVSLSDGSYLFSAEARLGTSTSDRSDGFAVEIDATAPALTSLGLARSSDTGAAGDLITEAAKVTIVGQAEAGATVELVGTSLKTIANINGGFSLPGIDLPPGTSELTLRVVDAAGNENHASLTLERLAASGAENAALAWNQITLDTIRADGATPIVASRTLAMESIAVLDVLAAIDGTPAIMVGLTAPANLSVDAAVAAAAHRALAYLYPGQAAALDQKLAADLADIPEGTDKAAGLSFGRAVADAVIALRDHDGWDAFVTYNTEGAPGQWVPTAPMFDVALGPQWGSLTPFALQSGDQFRPGVPPSLDSAEYAAALDEVMRLGSATSSERTAEQTQIARFWADGLGSFTPSGHWNAIATEAAQAEGLSLSDSARMLAMLNIGLADAGIAAWDAKYFYGSWRPITAIRRADEDGNPETTADPTWQPLLLTPAFPEYISGHSTYSATAATILTGVFGDFAFSTTSIGLPGVTRSFDSFDDAAAEAGQSRIYGGIHFQFANLSGQATGRLIGDWVFEAFSLETDTRAPVVLVDQHAGPVTAGVLTLTGFALDNLAGLASLQVKLDDSEMKSVAVDGAGRFSLNVNALFAGLADGQHILAFTAEDAAGNVGSRTFDFTRDTAPPTIALASVSDGADLTGASRLAGTVAGTGSDIVSLGYSFDDGLVHAISFDRMTGAFDAPFDLATLGVGPHELKLFAKDGGGNTTEIMIAVDLPAPVPFAVASITPANGAGDVGVTFRPQVTFTRPVDMASVNANTFFAADASGARIPANIVVSPDGLRALLFFDGPLPGSSIVKLNLDGDGIRAAGDGALLDGDGDGVVGGDVLTSFATVSRAPLPNTTITGVVVGPGADLKPMTYDDFRAGPDGAAHTPDDIFLEPIADAKVYILGFEDQAVFTDAQGRFTLTSVPGGIVKIAVDGRTATNAPTGVFYPEMVMDVSVRPGQVNTLMGTMGSTQEQTENLTRPEVYLPRLSDSIFQTLSDTTPTVITAGVEAGLNLTEAQRDKLQIIVQPGSALDENGQPVANAQVGIQMVDPALVRDMLPPGVMQLAATFTIQAPGVVAFSEQVAMSFPNLYRLAPGEKTFFYSFNHTTGLLEISGTATVSEDGLSVITDPGQGITSPGWFGPTPPGSNGAGNGDNNPNDYDPKSNVSHNRLLDLSRGNLPQDVKDALEREGADLQNIDDGRGDYVFDEYRVRVDQMPPGVTPEDFLREMLNDLNGTINDPEFDVINEFARRQTGDPTLGEFIDIDILGPDDGSVVLSQIADDHFVFATVDLGLFSQTGTHPENGAREFGFVRNLDGSVDFYTRGASRPNNILADIFGDLPQEVGWESLMRGISNEITKRGGRSSPGSIESWREDVSNEPDPPAPLEYLYKVQLLDVANPAGRVQEISGKTDVNGQYNVFVPANHAYIVTLYNPATNLYGTTGGFTSGSGLSTTLGTVHVTSQDYSDHDGDGLGDIAEYVVGTSSNRQDTDGDGLSDYAEIKSGTNPLDGIPVATGVLAAVGLQGRVRSLTVESEAGTVGSTAYIATDTYGLCLVDVSAPFTPVILAELDLAGIAVDVAVDTSLSIAAVAAGTGGLHLVEVSDLAAPVLVKTIAVNATKVELIDGVAFVNADGNLRSFDLTTGDEIQTLDLFGAATTVTGLAHGGSFLYVLDNSNIVHAVEVVNGLLMVERGSFTLALGLASIDRQLFVAEGVLYVPAGASYATINVANPAAMSLISGPDANNIVGAAIALNGSGLGVAVGSIAGNAIDLVRTDDPANTADFVTRIPLPAAPTSVAIGNGLAFVGAGNQLQVVNYLAFDTQGRSPTVKLTNSPVDVDSARPGIQVQDGQVVPFGVRIADDVQVRDVELLINGQVQRVDGAYPFDLRAVLPTIAANGGTSVTLQARARDTGGNAGLSDLITVELVPDTVRPQLIETNLIDNATVGSSFRTLRFNFSEPLDPATVSPNNFHLFGPDGIEIAPISIQLKNSDFTVQLTYAPLVLGEHRVEVDLADVTDRAGNRVAGPAVFDFPLDRLSISRNGEPFFIDEFNDGLSPPSGPLGANTYRVTGGPVESGGRLHLNATGAEAVDGIGGAAVVSEGVVLRTNIDPANLTAGLKSDDNFTVETTFDLGNLDSPQERYAVRLSDALQAGLVTPPDQLGDDIIELAIIRQLNGNLTVQLREIDRVADTITVIETMALAPPTGATQILLRLIHSTADVGAVVASFDYLANGTLVGSHTFNQVGRIFGTETPSDPSDDENWTLVQVLGVAPETNDASLLFKSFSVASFSMEWVGAAGGNANNPANWSENRVPNASDDAFIDLPAGQIVTFNSVNAEFGSLTVTAATLQQTSGTLAIVNGLKSNGNVSLNSGTLALNGNNNSVGSFNQLGGTLSGIGSLAIVAGAASLSGGLQTGTGTTLAQGGAALTGTSLALDAGRTLEFGATSTAAGSIVQVNLNGSNPQTGISEAGSGTLKIASGATFDDQTTGSGLYVYANNFGGADDGTTAAVNNFGAFIKSGSALTSTISAAFNNRGTVNVQSGTLVLSGGGTDVGGSYTGAGTFEFSGGTRTLDAASSITGNATFSGGTTTINGSYTGSGTMQVSGGAVTIAGAAITGSLVQTAGLLTGAGTLTASSSSEFSGGTQSGSGTTLAQGGAALTSTSFALDAGRTLEFGATSTAAGSIVQVNLNGSNPQTGISEAGSGTLKIASGATFDDQTTGSGLYVYANNFGGADDGTTAAVNNFGTFIKSGSALTSTISAAFNNRGTVNVQSGTLVLSGGGTDEGAIYLGAGTVEFAGGVRTLDAASSITGNATFSGGTTTINGTYNVSGSTAVSAGAALLAGTVTNLGDVLSISSGSLNAGNATAVGAITQTGGFFTGTSTLTATGISAFSGGTQAGTGTTVAQGGAALTGTSLALDAGRTLEFGATSTAAGSIVQVNLNGSNPQTGGSEAGSGTLKIASGATFDDQTTDSGLYVYANNFGGADDGTTAAVNNFGTFIKSGSALTSTISAAFNNRGTVNVQSGTLVLSGGGTDEGAIYLGAGTVEFASGVRTLDAASSITGNATFSAGTTTIDGSYTGSGTTHVSGGTVTFAGAATTGSLVQTGGLLAGTGTFTVAGLSEFSGGTESGSGATIAQGGAALTGTSLALDAGRTLEFGATSTAAGSIVQVNLNGSNPQTGGSEAGSGTLKIASGATFDDQTTDSGLYVYANNFGATDNGTTAAVTNEGTFIKSGSAATSTVSVDFINHGLLVADSGLLRFTEHVDNSGGVIQTQGGNLEFKSLAGGTVSIDDSTVHVLASANDFVMDFSSGEAGTIQFEINAQGTAAGGQPFFVATGLSITGWGVGDQIIVPEVFPSGNGYVPNAAGTGGTLSLTYIVSASGNTASALEVEIEVIGSYTADNFAFADQGNYTVITFDPTSVLAGQQSTALQNSLAPSIESSVEGAFVSAASEAEGVETDGFIFKPDTGFLGSPTETISQSDELGAFTAPTIFPSDQIAIGRSGSGLLLGSADEQFPLDASIDSFNVIDGNATRVDQAQFKVSTVVQSSDWLI